MNKILEKGDRLYRIQGDLMDLLVIVEVSPRLAIAEQESGWNRFDRKFKRKLFQDRERWIATLADNPVGYLDRYPTPVFVLANEQLDRQYEPHRVNSLLRHASHELYHLTKNLVGDDGVDRSEALALIQKAKSLLTTPVDR